MILGGSNRATASEVGVLTAVGILKCLLTPILIAGAAVASRRWGPQAGGWVAGLPLTSGPLSLFVAVEEGRRFAQASAVHTLLGLICVSCFSLTYGLIASRVKWPAALLAASASCLAVAGLLSRYHDPSPAFSFAGALLSCLGVVLVLRQRPTSSAARLPWWDIPLRIFVATAIVLVLSGEAAKIGAPKTGLVGALPVFAGIMCCFAHAHYGGISATNVLRGVVLAGFGFAVFFFAVCLFVEALGLWSYLLASVAALAVNGLVLGIAQPGSAERSLIRTKVQ
jgi:hypothetical protein